MNEETNKIATLNIMNLPVLSAVIGTAHISWCLYIWLWKRYLNISAAFIPYFPSTS
jgi:hypothetical protein